MDKGAHYYRCDFQVHTPRDLGWVGADAATEAERKTYAEELVLACRRKGLTAIAITDHHDLTFFPFVRRAAQEEVDEEGAPIPTDRQLTVFPGLELTLTAPACQVILLLDAAFPENLLQSVLTTLAITPAPETASKHAPIERIPQTVVSDLADLYMRLSSQAHLGGRFIVLPNVTETGHGTLLRSGFANFYKTMPCVGGYTDGPTSKFGKGNQSIVSGQNREYGFKAIAVFQTSDNRNRDHSVLGMHTTWVKWSEATAEALRQACLAKESRLSLETPELPSLWITSMSVSNSKFLGRVDVELNQQYNAVIGGRGTGKSTLLEYLRWGLCDHSVDSADSDLSPLQIRRSKLIADTLQKFDGEIVVTFLLNDVKHILKRSSKTQDIVLKIGSGEFAQVTEQEVRNLFPVQAYSQKQLSSIGVRLDELKRFVELPVKQALDTCRSSLRDNQAMLRAAYGSLVRKRELEAEIAKYRLEATSLSTQLAALRGALSGLSTDDQATIQIRSQYEDEGLVLETLRSNLGQAEALIATLNRDLGEGVGTWPEVAPTSVNATLVNGIRARYLDKFAEVRAQMAVLLDLFTDTSIDDLHAEVERWNALNAAFDERYEGAKAKAKDNQQQLVQIQAVEKRLAELNQLQMANQKALAALGDPESSYNDARTTWSSLHVQKLEILGEQCREFSALSNGTIRASVREGLDVEALKHRIKVAFAGLNIKEQKIDELCRRVLTADDPMASWIGILAELEGLVIHGPVATEPLPATPLMNAAGFIESERARVAAGLDSTKWVELSLTEIEFNPVFLYCANKETSEHIEFADASAGQQATALLTVLLNQGGAPLLIDQPEDDVDSKMSAEIVRQIWKAKSRRQLIFASHNANFVVNGDAELVVCCDYVKAGDQTGGQIKAAGAIDNIAIRDEITAVTEGGKDAFKLRMEKYGF
ncbi:MAG: AAA family ATPase [Thermoanaerobaculaceae bacterium]|nr:AAA family ATPase [Thermoanaerobaculaceae bacterium]MDI9621612.1 AAA family ATPase [Acidobacteriota bacterium]